MKTLFMPAKIQKDALPVVEKALESLPKKVGLVTTIQFLDQLPKIKTFLEKNNKKAVTGGQILGCDASAAKKIAKKVDKFLYIGSGHFHPIEIRLETGKDVIIANPVSGQVSKLKQEDINKLQTKKKTAFIKFHSAETVGILVSTKPGQNRLKQAFELKNKLKDKQYYVFINDTIDLADMENYPFIQAWVNTACPRLADYSSNIINIGDIK